jgi:hypothetical protein
VNGYEFISPSQVIPSPPKSSMLSTAWVQAKQSLKMVSFLNKNGNVDEANFDASIVAETKN